MVEVSRRRGKSRADQGRVHEAPVGEGLVDAGPDGFGVRGFAEIPESEPGMVVVHQLRAVTVELNLVAAEFAGANGLHVTDLRALIELLDAERDGIVATPGWLGEQLGLGSASATALVDRLERLGHVQRTRDDADRRRVLLAVTPSAKALGWAFFGPLMRRIVNAAAGLDEAQLATLRDFLTAVTDAVAADRQRRP